MTKIDPYTLNLGTYPLEVRQVYEWGVEVWISGIGPGGKQTERFMVPKLHIPAYSCYAVYEQGARRFTIQAENVYRTETWQWKVAERAENVEALLNQDVDVATLDKIIFVLQQWRDQVRKETERDG